MIVDEVSKFLRKYLEYESHGKEREGLVELNTQLDE